MTPERLAELERHFSGCGDNSCMIRPAKGMATNGGCRCFGERSTFKKVGVMAEEAQELIAALRTTMLEHAAAIGLVESVNRGVDAALRERRELRSKLAKLVDEVSFVISGGDDEHDKCTECGLAGIGMLRDARQEAENLLKEVRNA